MISALPRSYRILLASAVALVPSATAVALAQPSPAPVPIPYPLTINAHAVEPAPTAGAGPILCIPIKLCLPKGAGTLRLQASPGESTGGGPGKDIEVLAWSWGSVDTPPAGSADPQEGGEVVGGVDDRATPEAVARKRGAGRASVSEISPTIKADKASPMLKSKRHPGDAREPGKLEHPNISMEQSQAETPPPSGMVTLLVPFGSCVQGARYPAVTIRSEGKAYELHEVTVAECGPPTAARGKKAQTEKLQYLKFEMKEVQVSG